MATYIVTMHETWESFYQVDGAGSPEEARRMAEEGRGARLATQPMGERKVVTVEPVDEDVYES